MKSFHSLVACSFLFLFGCKKADNSNLCLPPTLQFSLEDKKVNVNVDGTAENGYDIEFDTAGFTQGSGTIQNFTGSTSQFTVPVYGNYDVFVRKKCASGSSSIWSSKFTVNVDGSTNSCGVPIGLGFDDYTTYYRLYWYAPSNGNFYDLEYGPSGFMIGNGTRIRTNDTHTYEAIFQAGVTYDFYVRSNCGGPAFSTWAGPHSVYAAHAANLTVPCTQPTNLYAYKTSGYEISYTSVGNGSVSYEVSISTSASSLSSNILSVSSPNGALYNSGGYSGTRYFWIRGKCVNNTFTPWSVSLVQ